MTRADKSEHGSKQNQAELGKTGNAHLAFRKDSPFDGHLYLREESIRSICDFLLTIWRGFSLLSLPLLEEEGLGLAHYRILFCIALYQNVTPSFLHGRLAITKQSFNRTLQELKIKGLVVQHSDKTDRRRRPLHLTREGRELEARILGLWKEKISSAYRQAGEDSVEGFRAVLKDLANLPYR